MMLLSLAVVVLGSTAVAADILGGQCENSLVALLPAASFSATSALTPPSNARIYNQGLTAWASEQADLAPHLQILFPAPKTITKIATSGRSGANQFVKTYKISYSKDGFNFLPYAPFNGVSYAFQGNVEAFSVKENMLPIALNGVLAIRIHPGTYHGAVATKVEVYGC